MRTLKDNRIRVMQIIPSLITGGGQRVALDLAYFLDPNTFNVKLVSLYPNSNKPLELYAEERGISVIYLNKRYGFDPKIFVELYKVISDFQPHIIHNHLYALYASMPAIILKKIPVRIHTIHTLASHETQGIHFYFTKFAFKKMNVIPVSISENVKETVLLGFGIDYSPLIYNGIDVKRFKFSNLKRSTIRSELEISGNDFVFVNVANMIDVKNHKLLLIAFQKFLRTIPNASLLLIGDGILKNDLMKLCSNLGIEKQVYFLGERTNIVDLMCAGDCFILPSKREGFPISLLEAMAVGKPVIASQVGGVPELIKHSQNGFLFTSDDCEELVLAMLNIFYNQENAQKMGNIGKKIVEKHFSVQTMIDQYANLYTEQLSKYANKNLMSEKQ